MPGALMVADQRGSWRAPKRTQLAGNPQAASGANNVVHRSTILICQGSLLEAARAALQAVRDREPADSRHRQQGGEVQVRSRQLCPALQPARSTVKRVPWACRCSHRKGGRACAVAGSPVCSPSCVAWTVAGLAMPLARTVHFAALARLACIMPCSLAAR